MTNDIQVGFLDKLNRWLLKNTKDLPDAKNECDCPACNKWAGEDYHLVSCFGGESNIAASMNSGPWNATDWLELRRCECGAFFTMENSNY